MSEASQYTAQQASDPATPAEVLAAIAEHRPDLRPYVAANPTAYPGLLDWLGNLGDPAVDAALQARGGAALAAEPPTAPLAPEPPTTPAAPAPEGFAAPGYQPPAAAAGAAGAAAGAAYGAGAAPGAYPAPETPAYGTPQAPGAYGAPPAGGGYAPPPGGPYGGPPGSPYGAPMGGPPKKRSLAWLWILLGILGVLIVGGVLLFVFVFNRVSNIVEDLPTVFGSINSDAQSYGDDPELDALWDACEGGDMQACDDLYFQSPVGSEYEDFGDTCGNRQAPGEYCAVGASGEQTSDESTSGRGSTSGEPFAYGDDAALDALWDACESGDMQACDDLYFDSPFGSEYEDFGDTCGNRQAPGQYCAQ
jgi:hypothetical protein